MLGRTPKDFDVATDARPDDVRRLFRNSRIIGRRFRLVHVFFKGEIVEVATFRRQPEAEAQASADDDLLITSDNAYGTPRQDAFRRDFTVNALFYNIDDFSVIDYVGGLDDLKAKRITTIGDPDVRFQEDPVRMLRACEFAARLGFGIDRASQEAIYRQRRELDKASKPRVTEEILQLLRCGHAGNAAQWMLDLGLLEEVLPEVRAMVRAQHPTGVDFGRMLPVIDAMAAEGNSLSDIGLLAAILLPGVLEGRQVIEQRRGRAMTRAALAKLVEDLAEPLFERFTLSRERRQRVIRSLTGFLRMCEPGWSDNSRQRFAQRPYFNDARFLFALLVRATGEGHEELERWDQSRGRRAERNDDHGGSEGRSEGQRPRRRRRRYRRRRRRS